MKANNIQTLEDFKSIHNWNAKFLAGQKFERLLVIKAIYKPNSKKGLKWECLCDCGKIKIVASSSLIQGSTKSCGCYQKEKVKKALLIHGETGSKKRCSVEYAAWSDMKSRCININNSRYKDYGGRGIKVCDRWINSFESFLEDMGRRPSQEHSIDRINNDGNYEPSNCRWSTSKEQANNRRKKSTYICK